MIQKEGGEARGPDDFDKTRDYRRIRLILWIYSTLPTCRDTWDSTQLRSIEPFLQANRKIIMLMKNEEIQEYMNQRILASKEELVLEKFERVKEWIRVFRSCSLIALILNLSKYSWLNRAMICRSFSEERRRSLCNAKKKRSRMNKLMNPWK